MCIYRSKKRKSLGARAGGERVAKTTANNETNNHFP